MAQQSIPRLAREVLSCIYDCSINISSLCRSLTVPTKRKRRRMWYELRIVDPEELNKLVCKKGASVVTGHPELWEFDLSKSANMTPARFNTSVQSEYKHMYISLGC